MKKIVITKPDEAPVINLHHIDMFTPIFAIKKGSYKVRGMIIKEEKGYILRVSESTGAYGHFDTREQCIRVGIDNYDYEFFVEN